MIPAGAVPEDEQASSDLDQTAADDDQTRADVDQSSSDRDQGAADRDQRAAEEDQAASDRDLADGLDPATYSRSRAIRHHSGEVRRNSSGQRHETAFIRDTVARERDRAAETRDRAAEARDHAADLRDAELSGLVAAAGVDRATSGEQVILRAARDRQRAADDRARAALHRAEAARDREQAARDREHAAGDRARAAAEREAASVDTLTGARRRGAGLAELQVEIDRSRRTDTPLVVAYVDVDGLKATNDARGHRAGDLVLTRVVGVLRGHLRSYELIVRLGGDEFLCALSGASIGDARRRFEEIAPEILAAGGGSITVGLAELGGEDTATDLVNRADADLLRTRAERTRGSGR